MGEGGGVGLDVGEDSAAFVVGLLFTAVGAGIFTVWALYFNLVRLVLFFWRKSMVTGQVVEVFHCRDSAKLQPWKELLVVYTPMGKNYSLQCKLRVDEEQDVHVSDQINLAFNALGPLHYSTRHPFGQPAGNRRAISVALCFLWCCTFVIAALIFAISGQYSYSYCIPTVAFVTALLVLIAFVYLMADKRVPSAGALQSEDEDEEDDQRVAARTDVEIELSEENDKERETSVPEPSWDSIDNKAEAEPEFAAEFPTSNSGTVDVQFDALSEEEGLEEPSIELDKYAEGLELGLMDGEEMETMAVMELDLKSTSLDLEEMEAMEELDN